MEGEVQQQAVSEQGFASRGGYGYTRGHRGGQRGQYNKVSQSH